MRVSGKIVISWAAMGCFAVLFSPGCEEIGFEESGEIDDLEFEERVASVGHTSNNLTPGQQLNRSEYLQAKDGSHRLSLQSDGNLVLRRMSDRTALWSSGTHGKSATYLKLQSDGNLVLRTASGASVWSTKTADSGATRLYLHSAGRLVLYRNSTVLWSASNNDDPKDTDDDEKDTDIDEKTVTTDFLLPHAGTRAWATTKGNQIIPNVRPYSGEGKAYFGQLHEHTRASSDGHPEAYADKAYADAKKNGMDFMALTDHGRDIDSSVQGESNKGEWKELTTADDKATINGQFVGLSGYELTKDAQHINIFNTNWMADRFRTNSDPTNAVKNTRLALNYIKQDPHVIAQFNHPGYSGGGHMNGFEYNKEFDRFISLIEVSRDVANKGPEGDLTHYYDAYIRALDKGWHVAPTSQDDNHSNRGKGSMKCRTGVIADKLTQTHILDALKSRRVYTTNDTNLQVSFKINGQEMGTILNKPTILTMEVNIFDPDGEKVSKMELISSGGKVVSTRSGSGKWSASLDPSRPYYFIRVYQPDGEGAITAPIWTDR